MATGCIDRLGIAKVVFDIVRIGANRTVCAVGW